MHLKLGMPSIRAWCCCLRWALAQKCETNRVTKSNSFALHANSVHALRLPYRWMGSHWICHLRRWKTRNKFWILQSHRLRIGIPFSTSHTQNRVQTHSHNCYSIFVFVAFFPIYHSFFFSLSSLSAFLFNK